MATQSEPERHVPPRPEKPPQVVKAQGGEGEDREWDCVDEAAWESFPASDAPAGWAGKDRSQTPSPKGESLKVEDHPEDQNSG